MARLYGYKRDIPSAKDWPAQRLLAAAPPPPESASLLNKCGGPAGVLNQPRNNCTAYATCKGIQISLGGLAALPSMAWDYYMAGCLEGSQKQDNGRYLRDALDALAKVGWPTADQWPDDDEHWNRHPGAEVHALAFDHAKLFRPAYYRVLTANELKQANAAGHPVVVGSEVGQSFEDQDGVTPLPYDPAEPALGGHAYLVVGYDPGGIRIWNSWGVSWANAGTGLLAWEWFPAFQDAWAITLETP